MISAIVPRARPLARIAARPIERVAVRPMASAAPQIKDAMPREAKQLVDEGAKYLDVRTVEEFRGGRAPASVNVPVVFLGGMGMQPNPEFVAAVEKAFPVKDQPLVVGCKSGRRSLMAIDLLAQAGYKDLTNVNGGFDLWAGQGLPVEA